MAIVTIAGAVKVASTGGILNPSDFPLLNRVNAILTEKAEVNIPRNCFIFEDR